MAPIPGLAVGSDTLAPWLETGVTLKELGTINLRPNAAGPAPSAWAIDFLRRGDQGGVGPFLVAVDLSNGQLWHFTFAPDSQLVQADNLNTGPGGSSDVYPPLFDDAVHHVRILVEEVGADLQATIFVDGNIAHLGGLSLGQAPNGHVARVRMSFIPDVAGPQVAVGHVAVWNSTEGIPDLDLTVDAAFGHPGETAGARWARLCTEEGIPRASTGVLADTSRMGPQYPDPFVSILAEAADAEAGILVDDIDNVGFRLRTRDTLYNQAAVLTLDYAGSEINPPLEPLIDDQATRNDVTVTRRDGGASQAVDPDSIAALGRYDTNLTLNVEHDRQLVHHAGWRLHLGTADDDRFPRLTVDLDANPHLADDVALVLPGDRIDLVNLPDGVAAAGQASLLVQGWQETIGSHRRVVTFNATPARPWEVGVYDDLATRYSTDGSVLAAAVDADDTTLTVATTTGPKYSVDDGSFDVEVAGEQMTVTAAAPLVEDTFTRTVVDGWGSADSGQTWITEGGAAGDYDVSGGVGTHSEGEGGGATRRTLLDLGLADLDVIWSVSIPEISSGTAAQAGLIVREDGANANFYIFRVLFLTNGNLDLRLSERVGGTETTIAQPAGVQGSYVGGTVVHTRCQAVGSTLRARLWTDSDPEPAHWQVEVVDDTFTAGGRVGLRSGLETGWTGTLPLVFSYHDFQTASPQRLTVTRATNGISKAHTTGEAVETADAARYAL